MNQGMWSTLESQAFYTDFFMYGQDFYVVTLCFSARPATQKVGKTVLEAK